MRKPAFCIFLWPLCSVIIFFIDHYCAGGYQISIAYCLFFILFIYKLSCFAKKTCLLGIQQGLTQTGLYSHSRWLEASNVGFKK